MGLAKMPANIARIAAYKQLIDHLKSECPCKWGFSLTVSSEVQRERRNKVNSKRNQITASGISFIWCSRRTSAVFQINSPS
jgi:hypothetical protein